MDYTDIIKAVITLMTALVSAFLVPYIKSKYSEAQLKKWQSIVDIAVSACAVYRWKQRIEKIEPQTQFEYFMDEHYPDERMQKIYPNMKFKNADVQQ